MKRRKISNYINPSFWVFLSISALLWYGNKMSGRYTTEIVLPIELVNDFSSSLWIEEPLRSVNCRVEGFGRQLLAYKMRFGDRVVIPMSQLTLVPLNGSEGVFRMDKSSLTGAISTVVKDLRIHEVLDTALTISVSPVESRRMPVESRLSIGLSDQYMQIGELSLKPDSVDVRGPVVMLDSMMAVFTEPREYMDLKMSVSGLVGLEQRKGVLLSEKEVAYSAEVLQFTQQTVEIMVEIENLPEHLKATIVPSRVTVVLNTPIRDYNRITEGLLRARIDYNVAQDNYNGRCFIRIDSLPVGAEVIRVDPQFVEPFFSRR